MMIPDINVLGLVMKYQILREFNATMIITIYHCRIHLLTEKTHKYFPHPYGLTCFLTCNHVFNLCWAEWYKPLILVVPWNSCGPNTEDGTWSTFLVWWTPYPIASVKPWSFTLSVLLYHNPYSAVPLRYHNKCFVSFKYILVGLTIAWLSWFTA